MKTMPLPEIIESLIGINKCSDAMAAAFLNEFANLVAESLSTDRSLTINGIGTFRLIELADGLSIEFAPDSALADAVNAPFSIFEPVELDDGVTADMLDNADLETASDSASSAELESCSTSESNNVFSTEKRPNDSDSIEKGNENDNTDSNNENIPGSDSGNKTELTHDSDEIPAGMPPIPAIPPIPSDTPATGFAAESKPQTDDRLECQADASQTAEQCNHRPSDENSAHSTTEHVADLDSDNHNQPPHERIIEREHLVKVTDKSHHTLHLILTALLSLVAGLAIGYFIRNHINIEGVKSVNISAEDVQVIHREPTQAEDETTSIGSKANNDEPTVAASSDTATKSKEQIETPATTQSKVVTDTIRSNRFLTTIALKHYGKKKFWVYIYEENRAILNDPDNIPANTVVVVPPAQKYGIKAGDPASEADAEKRAAEIMNQYH